MESYRLEKSHKLRSLGLNPYVNSYIVDYPISDITSRYTEADTPLDDTEYKVAGRIMAQREFGKTSFLTIKDRTGEIQVYIKKGLISDDEFVVYELSDTGDFVGVTGSLFRTKTGELTLRANSYKIVTKTLRNLPEKWHGLTDIEKRYRQRYLDLMVNEDTRTIFLKRSKVINELRNFFIKKDFIEVETPMMHPILGGAAAAPFVTHHNALDMPLFLRIAPELYLKRLVVGGFERVFEVNRNFRNEGTSTKHNPEFTMVEWYMAYADYNSLMDMIEELLKTIAMNVNGSATLSYNGNEINLGNKWLRITMIDSLAKFANITPDMIATRETAASIAWKNNINVDASWGRGKIIQMLFDELVEGQLINPTFIMDYPVEVSPLSKAKESDPELTDRFELFIAGMELANGFNELNDPIDQRNRFQKQVDNRDAGDEEACMMDEDYIRALEYGLPPTAGAGMGIDRLVMLITGEITIREVLLFPHMRPSDDLD